MQNQWLIASEHISFCNHVQNGVRNLASSASNNNVNWLRLEMRKQKVRNVQFIKPSDSNDFHNQRNKKKLIIAAEVTPLTKT